MRKWFWRKGIKNNLPNLKKKKKKKRKNSVCRKNLKRELALQVVKICRPLLVTHLTIKNRNGKQISLKEIMKYIQANPKFSG